MKLKFALSLFLTFLLMLSCVKPEVIPAPTPKVTLTSKFSGLINGTETEINEGDGGYTCVPTQDKNLVSSPVLSSSIYYSEIKSSSDKPSIRIGLGKIYWDAASSADPSIKTFNSFFISPSNILPKYKDNCSNGFNVQYTDGNGTIFTSRDTSSQFQSVKFTNTVQESDPTGDYTKYLCTFNCYVYYLSGPNPSNLLDSIKIQNAQFKGWFKK